MLQARLLSILPVILLALGGCSRLSRPEQARLGDQVNQDAFLHDHLQREPVVTVAEACRAMVILADGEDRFESYAAREEYLLSRKILRPEWRLQRDEAIDRGSVAYMVVQILRIQGGVNLNVMGRLAGLGDRRYAVRELVYHEIMEDLPPYRFISGAELVDAVGKADAYMAKNGLYTEPAADVVREVENGSPAGKK
jgi:hypothetical protein